MVAHRVEPHVRLHVQRGPAEDEGVEIPEELRRGGRAVHRVRLTLAVEGGALDPEPGGPSAELFDEGIGQTVAFAVRMQLLLGSEEPLVGRLQAFRDLLGCVTVGGEEGAGQLRVAGLAVIALAIVLHHELPVRVLDEVALGCHLGSGDVVAGDIGLDHGGDLVDVLRRCGAEADEDETADHAHLDRAQGEAGHIESGGLDSCGDELPAGGVGPLVVAADDVAHRARQVVEQPGAPVAAHIVMGPDRAVIVADDDDRVGADVDGHEVTGLGNLGHRGGEDPRRGEDRLEVAGEEVRTGVEGRGKRVSGTAAVDEPVDIVSGLAIARRDAVLWCQGQFVHHLFVISDAAPQLQSRGVFRTHSVRHRADEEKRSFFTRIMQ